MAVKQEIKEAARWWANCLLSKPEHDNGVPMHGVLAGMAATTVTRPTERQVVEFENALADLLTQEPGFDKHHWRDDDPMWGGAGRTVGVDYHPDQILSDAATRAGIDADLLLPWKTMMWIDPGCVTVSRGYGAPPEVVWSKNST